MSLCNSVPKPHQDWPFKDIRDRPGLGHRWSVNWHELTRSPGATRDRDVEQEVHWWWMLKLVETSWNHCQQIWHFCIAWHVNFLAPEKCPKWDGLYLSTGRLTKLHSISEGRGRSRSPPRRSRRDDSRDRHKLDLQLVKYVSLLLQVNRLLVFCANSEFPKGRDTALLCWKFLFRQTTAVKLLNVYNITYIYIYTHSFYILFAGKSLATFYWLLQT